MPRKSLEILGFDPTTELVYEDGLRPIISGSMELLVPAETQGVKVGFLFWDEDPSASGSTANLIRVEAKTSLEGRVVYYDGYASGLPEVTGPGTNLYADSGVIPPGRGDIVTLYPQDGWARVKIEGVEIPRFWDSGAGEYKPALFMEMVFLYSNIISAGGVIRNRRDMLNRGNKSAPFMGAQSKSGGSSSYGTGGASTRVDLTNDSHGIPVDASGNALSLQGAETTANIYEGTVNVSADWNMNIQSGGEVNVTGDLVDKTYTVTSLTDNAGSVTFEFTRSGYATLYATFTLFRNYSGITYTIDVVPNVVEYDTELDVYTPSSIDLAAFTIGASGRDTYSGYFRIFESADGINWGTATYSSASAESTYSYTITGTSQKFVKVELFKDNTFVSTSLVDVEVIPLLWEALQGEPGTPGHSVFTVEAYKLSETIPTDKPGTVSYNIDTSAWTPLNGWLTNLTSADLVGNPTIWLTTYNVNINDYSSSTITLQNNEWAEPVQVLIEGPQGPDGDDAVTGQLSNETHTVPTDVDGNNGNYAGATTTMSVFEGLVDASASWTYSVVKSNVTCTEVTTSRTQTVTAMSADSGYVEITASKSGYTTITKRFTLTKSKQGITGDDAVVAQLSNETHTVPTDVDGNNGNYTGATTTMSVFEGVTDVSGSWTYSVVKSNVTCSESTTSRTQTVTAMSADSGYVDITASRAGYSDVTKRFTLTKSKQGLTGTKGSEWFSGTGAPLGSLGVVGDFYIDTDTGNYYKKTGATTWTLQADLSGDPGAVWHSGSGAPATGLGVVGDFYINNDNGDYYEKTGVSTWTSRGNLKGAAGSAWYSGTGAPLGSLGVVGDFYIDTDTGNYYKKTGATTWTLQADLSGDPGAVWHSGSGAPAIGLGVVGDFYINNDTGDYYEKTGSSTWTIRGNLNGSKWYSGIGAPLGSLGVIDDFYIDTDTGNYYKKTGTTTWTLQADLSGDPGAVWHSGSGAPATGLGVVGDFYINNDNGDYYEKTGVSTWTSRGNLKGQVGPISPRTRTGFLYYRTATTTTPSGPTSLTYNFVTDTWGGTSFGSAAGKWYTEPLTYTGGVASEYYYVSYTVTENTYGVNESVSVSVPGTVQLGAGFTGLVTFTSLETEGQTTIHGGNIITETIKAGSLDVTALSSVSATIGELENRPNVASGYSTPYMRFTDTNSPIEIFDTHSGGTRLFGIDTVNDGGSTKTLVFIKGSLAAGTIGDAAWLTDSGVNALRSRLGTVTPTNPTGGSLIEENEVIGTTVSHTWTLAGSISSGGNGKSVVSSLKIYGNTSDTAASDPNYTPPSYSIQFQFYDGSWEDYGAPVSLTGSYSWFPGEPAEGIPARWTVSISATAIVDNVLPGPNAAIAAAGAMSWRGVITRTGGYSLSIEGEYFNVVEEQTGDVAVHQHTVSDITATGTASSSTYLRGDGTWATPAGANYSAGSGLSLSGTTFNVDIPGTTATTTVVGLDELLISDGGALRRVDLSVLANFIEGQASGYTHPAHPGDNASIDTGALSGATVISDLDFNITTDTEGHVTDANATVETRNLTAGNIGAEPSFAKNSAFNKDFGSNAGQVAEGNHTHSYLPLSGGTLTNDLAISKSNTTLDVMMTVVNTDNGGGAELQVRGNGQGDGYLFVGQSATYGGGIVYRGDTTSPKTMSGAGTDRITFFRRTNDVDSAVFSYLHNSNDVTFTGNITASNFNPTTIGSNLLSIANPVADRYIRVSSAGVVELRSAAQIGTEIGGTNLSITDGTTSGPTINSSTGTNAVFPAASINRSGAITTGNQVFAGSKTFSNNLSYPVQIRNTSTGTVISAIEFATGSPATINGKFGFVSTGAVRAEDSTGSPFWQVLSTGELSIGTVPWDHLTDVPSFSETNDYVNSIAFSTSTGVLTLGRTGALGDLSQDLDGRYSLDGHTHSYLPLSGGTLTNDLKLNTSLILNGTTTKQVSGGPELISAQGTASNKVIMWGGVNGETEAQFLLSCNGLMEWGSGGVSDQDMGFFRNGVGNLTVQSFTHNSTETFRVNTFSLGTGTEVLGVDTTNQLVRISQLLVNGGTGGATLDVAGSVGITGMRIMHTAAATTSFATAVNGDAQLRFAFLADGTMKWSSGALAPDVQLYRTGTRTLCVKPIGGDAVGTFRVLNNVGTDVFRVDTTNAKAYIGNRPALSHNNAYSSGTVYISSTDPGTIQNGDIWMEI